LDADHPENGGLIPCRFTILLFWPKIRFGQKFALAKSSRWLGIKRKRRRAQHPSRQRRHGRPRPNRSTQEVESGHISRRKRCLLPLIWSKPTAVNTNRGDSKLSQPMRSSTNVTAQSPMRGSMLCEVHTRTIRDDPERKKLAREEPAAESAWASTVRIPKVALLQPRRQLLRYLLSQPCLSLLPEDAKHSTLSWEQAQ
jgi:hypothetical protein